MRDKFTRENLVNLSVNFFKVFFYYRVLYLPLIDASVVRAFEPIVVPAPGTHVGEAAAEVDVAAVAGNRSRYLKDNVMSLLEI